MPSAEEITRHHDPGDGTTMDYNGCKQHVIREIYDRAFRAAGLL